MTDQEKCWEVINRLYEITIPSRYKPEFDREDGPWDWFYVYSKNKLPGITLGVKADKSKFILEVADNYSTHYLVSAENQYNVLRVMEARISRDLCAVMMALNEELQRVT